MRINLLPLLIAVYVWLPTLSAQTLPCNFGINSAGVSGCWSPVITPPTPIPVVVTGPAGPIGPVGPPGSCNGFGLLPTGGANTAILQSVDNAEQAGDNYCKSSNGTTGFTCKLQNKALAAYKEGMPLKLFADVPCTAAQNCSVNVDSVGLKTLKDSTGQNGAAFPAGFHLFNLDSNGVFRMAY